MNSHLAADEVSDQRPDDARGRFASESIDNFAGAAVAATARALAATCSADVITRVEGAHGLVAAVVVVLFAFRRKVEHGRSKLKKCCEDSVVMLNLRRGPAGPGRTLGEPVPNVTIMRCMKGAKSSYARQRLRNPSDEFEGSNAAA